jgi:hypothetical protein
MATQSLNGAGFEYACADALLKNYRDHDRSLYIDQPSIPGFKLRQRKFDDVKFEIRTMMRRASFGLASQIGASKERWAKGMFLSGVDYKMRIGDNARNMDVRDLVIYSDRGAQLGISLKWNNDEIKSLRLGDPWSHQFHIYDDCCWQSAISEHHRQLEHFELWRDAVAEMGLDGVYGPYRNAMIKQLSQGMHNGATVRALSEFIFGKQSYLKAMAIAKGKTISLAYYDTGNLPTRIKEIAPSPKGEHYLEITFDRGWTLLARLHNKDKKIRHGSVGAGMSVTFTVVGWGEKSGQRCWDV